MANIVLGVSGSIAAYKAAVLASLLVKAGHSVYPVMTESAAKFLGSATLAALTDHPCPVDVFEQPFAGEIAHIYLAGIADVVAIVPASMDILARFANGLTGDMLTATVAATRAPILLAPGMNSAMWDSGANQANLAKLVEFGYQFIDPVSGRLACHTVGVGKMAEPEDIFAAIEEALNAKRTMANVNVLITAGPTREPIDAVRSITNRSSGKMGYALAEAARARAANVTLISGPVRLLGPVGVRTVQVETAAQMYDAALSEFDKADIVIAAAAVADYTPSEPQAGKIKKAEGTLTIELTPTADILAELGRRKQRQVLVGFAAESENLVANARKKLFAKNLDWIIANDISREGAGFDVDTNAAVLIARHGAETELPLMSKRAMAERILDAVAAGRVV